MTAQQQRSDALAMFGLTGDLGRKKLFPAIYELAAAGRLDMPVIGIGRSEYTDDELGAMFRDALEDFRPSSGRPVDPDVVDRVALSYLRGDSTRSTVYDELAERFPGCHQPVVYAALPPDIFGSVAAGIANSSLCDGIRLVVEKPFGDGADSARRLWNRMTDSLPAEQLFIVDHFLAKAPIENVLTMRSTNPLLHNSLDAAHVESIEIEMSETGGVDGRGSFYEGVGAIKDVVQNHLMQLLAALTMEPPADDTEEALHRARQELLEAVVPIAASDVVVGQYAGYRELDDVDPASTVETFASLRLDLDTERWRGVPVTMRTGKRLAEDRTEATFHLRPTAPSRRALPNRIRFTIKPNASVSLDLGVLDPESHEPSPTTVVACGPTGHGQLGDYATMFENALAGETRHFAQIDGIVASWRALAPVLAADLELRVYEPGSTGP